MLHRLNISHLERADIKEYTTAAFYNSVGRCCAQFIPSLVFNIKGSEIFFVMLYSHWGFGFQLPSWMNAPDEEMVHPGIIATDPGSLHSGCETCRKEWVQDSRLEPVRIVLWWLWSMKSKGWLWSVSFQTLSWADDSGSLFSPKG